MNAIEHDGVQSVQIIVNMFRLKPADAFFAAAVARMPPLSAETMARVRSVYDVHFRETTHAQW